MRNSRALVLVGALALSLGLPTSAALASSWDQGSLQTARPSQLAAERVIYAKLDAALDFVGATHTNPSGALKWLSVEGDDSGAISCTSLTTTAFRCNWHATLIQSYTGNAKVLFDKQAPVVVFSNSRCVNPKPPKGYSYPNLCALDPVPGMAGHSSR